MYNILLIQIVSYILQTTDPDISPRPIRRDRFAATVSPRTVSPQTISPLYHFAADRFAAGPFAATVSPRRANLPTKYQ